MPHTRAAIERVEAALVALRKGRLVVLTDDEDRENEGDLVMAAEKVTPEAINFMATHGRGLICLSLTEAKLKALQLPMMVQDNTSPFETGFTVSIEAARGVTTGISAADRAHTIRVAVARNAKPRDLVRPGHIFPLRAREGGVLVRTGQTEGSVDLARLAGLEPAGVICEIMREDGTMARRPDLLRFCRKHRLPLLSVADLITWRLARERIVREVSSVELEHPLWGPTRVVAFQSSVDPTLHLAFVKGTPSGDTPCLVRVHRTHLLRDSLEASTGGGALKDAFAAIAREDSGVVLVLQAPFDGPLVKSRPAASQKKPRRAQALPQLREFGIGAQILRSLGLGPIRLLTHSPKRIVGLERYGLALVEQIRLSAPRGGKASTTPV